MSDTPQEGEGQQVATIVGQAEEAARKAHEARQRADDDASYAHNAKMAAEEHSKTIAALKAQADADASWFTTTKQNADEVRAAITQIRVEAESSKQSAATAVAEIERSRAAAKSGAEQVDLLKAQAEKHGSDTATHSRSAGACATQAGESAEAAAGAHAKAEKLLAQVTEHATKTAEQAVQIEAALQDIKQSEDASRALVATMAVADKKSAQVLAIIEGHESDLARLKAECDTLHKRIESLLPNATSAGLATAFRDQKSRFTRPQRGWLAAFILAIVALLGAGLYGLPTADGSWDQMAKHFINRLPLIAPLVWLAVYAGRHYGLALRLQEEYAYKEAVSAAFEGYKREMTSVAAAVEGPAGPLVTLCESVLRTLGQRPGRIYEGKHEDITALTPLATAVKDGAQAAAGIVRGQLPAPGGSATTAA
jgi:uncharacterized coiled-coil DUF342 family protein